MLYIFCKIRRGSTSVKAKVVRHSLAGKNHFYRNISFQFCFSSVTDLLKENIKSPYLLQKELLKLCSFIMSENYQEFIVFGMTGVSEQHYTLDVLSSKIQ